MSHAAEPYAQQLAPLTADNPTFAAAWPVRAGDVDPDNRLRLDGVARYLQDIAWENLQATFFKDTDPMWIVRRTVIDVVSPIVWPDTVELHRWCSAMSTRWTDMRVRMTSANGGLVETMGFWINISASTGMPTRISDKALAYLSESTNEQRLRWRPWLTEPGPPESESDKAFHLRATDIDQYNHVNNAAYWHAVEEQLVDLPKLVAVPHRATIEYISPVLANEHVMVRGRFDDTEIPTLKLWFVVDGEVRTAVRVHQLDPSE
ncbi:acyl-[acyl-carrier-protein] thioesterase [Antrihabitans cavernicola]|uniref:acyl-[acyl-carrier-protein] thioesterase n=1 Tax=Antrihabitans cavernicola TaxID=2495913 RepID=UPI001F2C81E6|nr:acyl-ACP thioesterase domain-containing protein [Spelaeibacter cavernicola]